MIFKELSSLTEKEKLEVLKRGKRKEATLVQDIINEVKVGGDKALKAFTKRYDRADVREFRVSEKEIKEAEEKADSGIVSAIEKAHKNILSYHKKQLDNEWWIDENDRRLGQIIRPVGSVGCYVPGGRAFYPSSVLMAAVPASVAGVQRIVCTTPPQKDGRINEYTLMACSLAGVDEVYKVGGAQAIAALAYGTRSIPKVDLIVGPGNVYVTAAKKAVFGDVGIDMLAGPSEVLIIADSSGDAEFISSDIFAQAEHDPNAACVFITTDRELAIKVKNKVESMDVKAIPSLENVAIFTTDDLKEAISFSNEYAPEHLEIIAEDEKSILDEIINAGSIFLGPYSPVAAGDYASGPNHILPTGGCARFQSGLNVGNFIKKISVQRLSKKGLKDISVAAKTLSNAEGLIYHKESIEKRF